jgi:hypothetical protein
MKTRKQLVLYTTCVMMALGLLSACRGATSTPPPQPLCDLVLPEPGPWRQVWRCRSDPAGVNDMLHDGDWLWVATPNDVVRLDLRTLDCTRFSHTAGDPEVPLKGVRALLLDPKGRLWAGGGKRLARFDGQKWQAVYPDLDTRCMYVHSLAFDAAGSLWITSMSSCGGGGGAGGAIQVRYPGQPPVDGQWEGETISGGMPSQRENTCERWVATWEFRSPEECWLLAAWRERLASLAPPEGIAPWGENPPIAAETGDRLWVLARHFPDKPYDTLLSFDGQDWWVRPWSYGYPRRLVADEARGGVWAGTNEGLVFSDGQTLRKFSLTPGDLVPVGPAVYDLVADSRGRLWASTEQGLLLYDETTDSWQPTEISEWVLISADDQGGLWAISHSREGRASHFDGETWSHHPFPKGWPCLPEDVLADVGGGLWLSSIECALRGFNGEVWDEYDSGSRGELLARGLESDIYAATWDGAVKRGTKWETLLPADPLRRKPLDLVVSQEGEIWVAFDAVPSLLVYRDGEWHEVQTPVEEPINALLIDSQGNLWAGYGGLWASDDSGGLLRYDGETWEQINEWPGIVALAEDQRGRIWVGGRHGLSVYDPPPATFTISLIRPFAIR